jgi:hypothetical protein
VQEVLSCPAKEVAPRKESSMTNHSNKLRKGQTRELADERRARMAKLISLRAPEIIIIAAAENYLLTFKLSWRGMWGDFKNRHFPHWLVWLVDADYRALCREPVDEEFEREVIKFMALRKEAKK